MSPTLARRPLVTLLAALLTILMLAPAGAAAPRAATPDGWPIPPVGARVGLQVGHLRIADLPDDQARLRGQTGGSGGGYREVDVNLAVVTRAAALLEARGVTVDILPAAVPPRYQADAFIAVHCDASADTGANGYKLARYRASQLPIADDLLIASLSEAYGAATGLRLDDNITRPMTGYYAYNARLYRSIISPQTPSAIFELGYLTNPGDRALLTGRQDALAAALAGGVLRFLAANGRSWATVLDTSFLLP